MGKNKQIYIVIIAIIILVLLFALIRSLGIKKARLNDIDSIITDNTYSLFFSGDLNKEQKQYLKKIKEENDIKIYNLTDSRDDVVNYIKTKENVNAIEGNIYILYDSKGYLGFIDSSKNTDDYIKKYLYGYLPINEREFLTTTVSQYNQMYNSKNVTIAVFGENSCSYCDKLQVVINDIAKNKLYDIYYFDIEAIGTTDYNELMDMKIKIPASCNSLDKEQTMSEGFAKPMTIVSKKGKVIGCIKGYYDYNTYTTKLKSILEG